MNKKHQPTTQELNRAIASFLIVLGKHLPPNLVVRMAQDMEQLAARIETGGEPNVGMLTRDFASALSRLPGEGLPKSH